LKSEQNVFISGVFDPMRSDRSAGMIFIIFLVSLGTIRIILASEERHKQKQSAAGITPSPALPADLPTVVESTGGVWNLMRAIEEHGRGKEPEMEPAGGPVAASATHEPPV
jgi:hypothetical protein